MDWVIGAVCSFIIAGVAYKKNSLSISGVTAAIFVGTILYTLGSIVWFGPLLAFFITSTLLTNWKQKQKKKVEDHYEKTGRRDAGQVLANGGFGALLCIAHSFQPADMWWVAFLGVMATVNADTWATEIGGVSKSSPRSILSGKKVSPGTSGGITLLGLGASLFGGLFIGGTAWVFSQTSSLSYLFLLLVICSISGIIGSLTDSFLGATCQVMYRCQQCQREVEAKRHCYMASSHIRGWKWMNNDTVNTLSSLVGALVAIFIANLL